MEANHLMGMFSVGRFESVGTSGSLGVRKDVSILAPIPAVFVVTGGLSLFIKNIIPIPVQSQARIMELKFAEMGGRLEEIKWLSREDPGNVTQVQHHGHFYISFL